MEMAVSEKEAGSHKLQIAWFVRQGPGNPAWDILVRWLSRGLSSSLSFLVVASTFEESRRPLLFLDGK